MVSTVRYDVVVHTIYCFDLGLYLMLGFVQSMGQQDKGCVCCSVAPTPLSGLNGQSVLEMSKQTCWTY